MLTKESIVQKLKERGLRITPQRLSIIDVLVKKGHLHPSASFIYNEAKKKGIPLSLSSVYENIKELCRYKIIKSLEFDGRENRCEANLGEHINLICEHCGKIIDYELPVSINQTDVAKRTGFMITHNRLEYYGYCAECTKGKGWPISDHKPLGAPL
ncbi:MAG TPA: Fur family transcriptional regulator [Syntrophales bacterium]|nr:Fur family transcriptional regulator [Syntrophales bacterium]HPN08568.1 Fur family transcriptional regulator [Syntrophales bacterium]HPX81819.1 Fur family transcriptional regulator [Syntrophales bacterium]HQB12952.1 Fur family transcriptional regulator [Syntrophales bacterium]HQM82945.1 Fur family transcriptional regulator [Syntrophorhabdaceae bacterium]